MRGLTRDTWAELRDRRVLYVFGALTFLALGFILLSSWFSGNIHMIQDGQNITPQFADIKEIALLKGFSQFMAFALLLAVLSTVTLLPRMMEKGRAEFYLAKPINRTSLLLGKLFGVWTVYGAVFCVCGAITYIVLGVLFRSLDPGVLYLFGVYLVCFAIWLSITIFVGVISGSASMAIMAAFATWVAQYLLQSRDTVLALIDSKVMSAVLNGLYYILPKPSQIISMAENMALGSPVESWMPLWSSLVFAGVLLYLTVFIYTRKNY